MKKYNTDEKFMALALVQAKKALKYGDVPIGAVLVMNNKVISRGYNKREQCNISTYHAEVVCIEKACKKLGNWNLSGAKLYVTLEPCVMCAGTIVNARISEVIFGAYDKKFGCCGSVLNLANCDKLNHRATIRGGVLENRCSALVSDFFRNLRNVRKNNPNKKININTNNIDNN